MSKKSTVDQLTLQNMSVAQGWQIIEKAVDEWLQAVRYSSKDTIEDKKNARDALIREFANGNTKRKALMDELVYEKIQKYFSYIN